MEELTAALGDLSAAAASSRLAASRVLERAARSESNANRQQALGHRTATAALVKALGDGDLKVVQNAVIALAEISQRYFKDDRAYRPLVRELDSADALTRLWAVRATVTLRGAASLPDVLPLARDRSAKVRAEVVRVVIELARRPDLAADARSQLRALASTAAADADGQVREFAANLAAAVGSPTG